MLTGFELYPRWVPLFKQLGPDKSLSSGQVLGKTIELFTGWIFMRWPSAINLLNN